MKVKLSQKQIEEILANPEAARMSGVKASGPWWVIVLKVISYVIGLALAGVATTSCANVVASALG